MKVYNKIFKRDCYSFGIIDEPIYACINPGWKPIVIWYNVKLKSGTFLADPFGVEINRKKYIFCEYFDYRKINGKIVSIELKDNGQYGDIINILDMPYHVSYPYSFKDNGNYYFLPETSQANELSIYKINRHINKLDKIHTINGCISALDPSIINYGNYWWIFYSDNKADKLYILYAKSLFGEWKKHNKSPIQVGKQYARSAGSIFEYNKVLYRPVQDCSEKYGKKIYIKKILKLNQYQYEDETVNVINPLQDGSFPDGIHTISSIGNKTLIDGKKEKFILSAIIRSLKKYINIIPRNSV